MIPDNPPNAVDRGVYISDNLPFLKGLNDGCVDLVCIAPPFGKKQTFEGKLKLPLSADECHIEQDMMASWGVYDAAMAYEAGLEYPDQSGTTARFRDIWAFECLFDDGWLESLKEAFPAAWWLIQATRYSHGEQMAAYMGFMLERLVEIKRVLKDTGSVYLHCDHEAKVYLRQTMDVVFGPENFRNQIAWRKYAGRKNYAGSMFSTQQDAVLFYQKTAENRFEPAQELRALAPRMIEDSCPEGGVVLACFACCACVPAAAELVGRCWVACDVSPRAWTVVRRQFHMQRTLRVRTDGDLTFDQPLQFRLDDDRVISIHGPNQLPTRETS